MSTGNIPVPTRCVAPGQVYNVILPQPSATQIWFVEEHCKVKLLRDDTVILQDNGATVFTTYRFLQLRLSRKADRCDKPYIDLRLVNSTTGAIVSTFRQYVEVSC